MITAWVSRDAYKEMLRLASLKFPFETGGMLLGYTAENGDVVITGVVGPGPKAEHYRFRFRPDTEFQQEQLETHFSRTEGVETYLGDWHTHPKGSCSLSIIDRRTLARIATTPSSGTINPLMVVLSDGPVQWKIAAMRFISSENWILFKRYQIRESEIRYFDRKGVGDKDVEAKDVY